MKRNVENFVALVEHVLDAVAMMNIPVEDQHSVQALFSHLGQVSQVHIYSRYFFSKGKSHRPLCRNGDIVEKTEAMRSMRFSVVAWRWEK